LLVSVTLALGIPVDVGGSGPQPGVFARGAVEALEHAHEQGGLLEREASLDEIGDGHQKNFRVSNQPTISMAPISAAALLAKG
jgi:hypothetical protein